MTRFEPWKSLSAAVKRRSVVLAGGQDKLAGKDAYGATRTAAVPA